MRLSWLASGTQARAPLSLRAGVAWSGLGSAVYLACQYGMLIAIAKLGSVADVGRFALAQAIATPVIIISQMQLRQAHVTDVQGHIRFGHYVSTRLIASVAALAAITVIALVLGFRGELLLVIAVMGLAKVCDSLSDIAHARLQLQERLDLVARSLVIKGVLSLAALSTALWLTRSLLAGMVALAVAWALVTALYDFPRARRITGNTLPIWEWDATVAGGLARSTWALTVAAGVGAFSGNLPRYFLEAAQGSEAVGLFAVAAAPLTLLGLGNSALNQATLARAAQYYQRGELGLFTRLARQITFLQLTVSAALAIVLALFGGPIMRILFSAEFVSVAPIAALMAAGVAVGALGARGSLIITAARNFELQLWNILLVTAAQLPLCWWLIGRQGLAGAGWSEFARYAISATFLALAGMSLFRERVAQPAASEGNAVPSPAPLSQAG